MQLFCADTKYNVLKKISTFFFAPENMKKDPQKLLIIGPDPFFHYCQSAQIQPKYQLLFHKNLPTRDLSIMTLPVDLWLVQIQDILPILDPLTDLEGKLFVWLDQ